MIVEVERVAVGVVLPVFSVEGEADSQGLGDVLKSLFQSFPNRRELSWAREREIEVFGKAVVAKMAAFESGATFEDEEAAEPALAQAN